MTELSFHGIHTLRQKAESVNHVSGTNCHQRLRLLTRFELSTQVTLALEDIAGLQISRSAARRRPARIGS